MLASLWGPSLSFVTQNCRIHVEWNLYYLADLPVAYPKSLVLSSMSDINTILQALFFYVAFKSLVLVGFICQTMLGWFYEWIWLPNFFMNFVTFTTEASYWCLMDPSLKVRGGTQLGDIKETLIILYIEWSNVIKMAWVSQHPHIIILKSKAMDFHLCKIESIYVILRITLDVTWPLV